MIPETVLNDEYLYRPGEYLNPNERGLEKWNDGKLVTFPVSVRYNGGIVVNGKWYRGFKVAPPIVPEGYEIYSIHCGLQYCWPPHATVCIRKKDPCPTNSSPT